jgi:hypothetical protein
LTRPGLQETSQPVRRRDHPHWLLSVLLILVVSAVVLNSSRASGARRPPLGATQISDDVAGHMAARQAVTIPTRPAKTALNATGASDQAVAGGLLSALVAPPTQLMPRPAQSPNEVGQILILEYHAFTTDPGQAGQWVRTLDAFRADLEWLYEHNFAVVPLRDVFLNRIAAPRGKHPVVLTFDDGTVGQFRFLPQPDGTLRVDPNSAVGVLEAMFAEHPDFGRGGHFAVLPFNCFHVPNAPDQEPLCDAKLRWLEAHGYGVGNHTVGHTDLLDVDDATFKSTIGDAITWAETAVPDSSADILTMPFGNYPDPEKHPEQMRWLRGGFTHEGRQVKLLGALMVGGGPAPSPVSVLWDPVKVPRIQATDAVLSYWQAYCETHEHLLYTSDGDPDTIAVLRDVPPQLQGAFDPSRAAGRRIVLS